LATGAAALAGHGLLGGSSLLRRSLLGSDLFHGDLLGSRNLLRGIAFFAGAAFFAAGLHDRSLARRLGGFNHLGRGFGIGLLRSSIDLGYRCDGLHVVGFDDFVSHIVLTSLGHVALHKIVHCRCEVKHFLCSAQ
jgi:hypothetical protein